jgi:hypothetical protein
MSPKASRSADEPGDETAEPDLPPGYVQMSRPKRRPEPVSWWWKSAGLVVLLAAAIITIMYIVKGPGPRESARGTTNLVAESLTEADMPTFRSYVCDSDKLEIPDSWMDMGTTSVLDVSFEHDGVATATLTTSKRPDMDLVLLLHSKDEQWCVVVVTTCPRYLDAPSASAMPDVKGCRNRPGR